MLDSNCSNASRAAVWAPAYFSMYCIYMLPALYRPALDTSYSITYLTGGSFARVFIGMDWVHVV